MARLSILSWNAFDSLLRGKLNFSERVRLLGVWIGWQALCAAIFGASLGVYSLTSRPEFDPRFMIGSTIKMPLLLFLTSAVTCPSLYVFGALRGLRFSAREFAAMLMVAHTILAAVLGSLAPVMAFFALTTTSYSFMILLTVATCGLAGLMGVAVFVRAMNEPPAEQPVLEPAPAPVVDDAASNDAPPPPVPRLFAKPQHVTQSVWQLLGWWVVLYIFVGMQMGWILRPFIGSPEKPFVVFRGKGGSMVEDVLKHIGHLAESDRNKAAR